MKSIVKDARLKSPAAAVVIVLLIAVIVALFMKIAMPARPALEKNVPARPGAAAGKDVDRRVYVCPTMCIPPVSKPGTCPICGMQLVAVSGEEEGDKNAAPRMRLSEEALKLAEIRVAPVERKAVSAEITAFGQLAYFPPLVSRVTAIISGVVAKEYQEGVGNMVKYGEPLFEIYSYDIYLAQQELLNTMKSLSGTLPLPPAPAPREKILQPQAANPRPAPKQKQSVKSTEAERQRVAALVQKLGRLGLTQQDMDLVLRTGVPRGTVTVYARLNGLIIEKKAALGSYVNIGVELCVIANPQNLWLTLSVYESDFPWLRINQPVEFQTEAYPGERFAGRIASVGPVFNKESRTFEVAVKIPDSAGKLRADMAVRAIIRAELTAGPAGITGTGPGKHAPLVIPAAAPLLTGKRAVVYVAVPGEKGLFEGREIVLGLRAKDYYVVKDGLKEGEQVVVNGNFKIDSALQILARPSMINSVAADQVRRPLPGEDIHVVPAGTPEVEKK
jgi:membrane fusion protein, copper/silver efflux system